MAKVKTQPFDEAKHLETDEDVAIYLDEILQDGEPRLIAHALGVVARAKGMTAIAKEAGLTRESLYKALSADGNPEFATVLAVLRALRLRLSVAAAE